MKTRYFLKIQSVNYNLTFRLDIDGVMLYLSGRY